jgi:condensin complex subunit 1
MTSCICYNIIFPDSFSLLQVFSQDKSIYEAVESAFISIYTKRIPTETAKSLINLNIDCSIGDLAALEKLISSLVLKGEISSSTVRSSFSFNVCYAQSY